MSGPQFSDRNGWGSYREPPHPYGHFQPPPPPVNDPRSRDPHRRHGEYPRGPADARAFNRPQGFSGPQPPSYPPPRRGDVAGPRDAEPWRSQRGVSDRGSWAGGAAPTSRSPRTSTRDNVTSGKGQKENLTATAAESPLTWTNALVSLALVSSSEFAEIARSPYLQQLRAQRWGVATRKKNGPQTAAVHPQTPTVSTKRKHADSFDRPRGKRASTGHSSSPTAGRSSSNSGAVSTKQSSTVQHTSNRQGIKSATAGGDHGVASRARATGTTSNPRQATKLATAGGDHGVASRARATGTEQTVTPKDPSPSLSKKQSSLPSNKPASKPNPSAARTQAPVRKPPKASINALRTLMRHPRAMKALRWLEGYAAQGLIDEHDLKFGVDQLIARVNAR